MRLTTNLAAALADRSNREAAERQARFEDLDTWNDCDQDERDDWVNEIIRDWVASLR